MNFRYCLIFALGLCGSLLLGFTSPLSAQAPANDECSGATTITALPDTITQNTRLATTNVTDPVFDCGDGGGGKTVWFKYTATDTNYVTFTTAESTPTDYDIAMALFTGTCGNLTEVYCNDDIVAGTVRQSELTVKLKKDSTYYICVAEWKGGGPSGGVPTGGDLVFRVYNPSNVYYVHGPKTGHVASGALVNTGSFTDMGPIAPPQQGGREAAENRRTKLLPLPPNAKPALAPQGSNFKEQRLTDAVESVVTPPHSTLDFKGFDSDGFIPPDVIMAVGPNHIIGMVNSQFKIYDKSGTVLKNIDCNQWWSNVMPSPGYSDPQVIYDHYTHRWVMVGIGTSVTPLDILISVSDDDNPLGAWYNYHLPGGDVGDSVVTGAISDHPQIGYDSVGFYITTRGGATGSRVMIFNKTQLYANNGGAMTWNDFWGFRDPEQPSTGIDWPKPSIMFGNYPGCHFMVNTSPYDVGRFVMVWTIHDPVGSPTITGADVPVVEYRDAPDPSQFGGNTFEGSGGVMQHKAVYRDSSLWMVHNVAIGSNNQYSGVHYVRVNPFTNVDQEDVVLGKTGYWCFYPSIMVNPNHDLVIGFTRTGLHEYAGAYFTGRRGSDPFSLSPSMPLKEGLGNYYLTFGGTRNRWGDYNGVALDPSDSSTFWVHTEWADGLNSWGTWMGKLTLDPAAGKKLMVDHSKAFFGTYETGLESDTVTFAMANGGSTPVTVNSIDLPDTNFRYINIPSTPFQIAAGGTVEFGVSFAPKVRGTYLDTIKINSDDGTNPVANIVLSGTAYSIGKAQKGILYAVSGNTGKVYTVNRTTGAATLLGPSGYEKIVSARVNLRTRAMVGFVAPSALVRVSAELGDAHPLIQLTQATVSVKGMVYRGDTILLGQGGGGIYRLDEVGDTLVQVASTGLGIAGMDFNPITGDLWLSVRTGTLDGIYKMKYPNGTPTLVGRTGFNTVTQDILFDGVGNLYGVTGSGSTINNLVKIDTTNGHGTLIGSMGVPIVQGLAWIPDTLLGIAQFGVVPTDTTGHASISLDNTTSDTLKILSVDVSDPTSYSVSTGPMALAPGGHTSIDIDFHPATAGNKGGRITFATDTLHRDLVVGLSGIAIRRGSVVSSYNGSWNLVSVPVVTSDYRRSILFPGSTGSAFRYNAGYIAAETLANSVGYWLKFADSTAIGFPGDFTLSDTIPVNAGWNLVGALTHPVAPSGAVGVHTGSLSSFFGFDMGYAVADTVRPGLGYWVRTDSAGKIVLPNAGGAGAGGKVNGMTVAQREFNVLHIVDADGMRQDLYFGTKSEGMPSLKSFEMPPLPPAGIFDARFASNRNVEYLETGMAGTFPVNLVSAVYPVTLSWEVRNQTVDCILTTGSSSISLTGSGSETIMRADGAIAISTSGSKAVPAKFALGQNYPNPFNPTTRIQYELASDVHVSLKIYDVLGREVAELVNADQQAGYKSVEWNAAGVPSGVYFYRIQAGQFNDSKKLMLLR